ncbi:chloride channel protein [Pararobbsia alpina]|uniref:Voltage-gated ClC-type chloride channel ClcB n=1 Tax=Pararobbsia alpina TaxID=621374 RepID=A0A6S7BAT4_9BURK|nr:chloride channel protein [Pararobbsia alpina]CAB3793866.1 Voltage-gated ClC-type chloride channel ClcB [Pararobbsia alpina]
MRQGSHKRDFSKNSRLLTLSSLATVIGGISTLAACVLIALIHLFTNLFFFGTVSFADRSPSHNFLGAWVVVVPVVGGLIVGLMARYGSEKIRGHGIPEAIEAILFGKSRMSPRVAALKPLSSAIVIGSGGPFGAEGPIIVTGGALASLLAQCFELSAAERKALLVAGAAAGMTAVFGTPVAAVLLAVELLLFEWRPRSFLPVAIACAVAGFARAAFFGTGPLFPLVTASPNGLALLSCVVAGLLAGALASGLSVTLYKIEDLFGTLRIHWMWWPAIGGLIVGIGGYFEPRALGVGYDVIDDLLHMHIVLQVVVGVLAVKAVIWLFALGSGTSGGVLAPLLMLGAGLGAVLSHVLPGGEPALWPLVCMAAVLGATLGAPLTAIVFAFGLTHDANALLPLLAATLVAHGFSTVVMKRSILTEKIARRGRHIYREYGVDPLERHYVDEIMCRDVETIDASLSVQQALETYFGSRQTHRAYPVIRGGKVVGMADRTVLESGSNGSGSLARSISIADAMPDNGLVVALPEETCKLVAARMAAHGLQRLAVVDSTETMRLIGIVSRSDVIELSFAHFEEEHRTEHFRPFIRPRSGQLPG